MKTQKRIVARILKVGQSRVWIDPEAIEEVSGAMTAGDIRKYIGLGFIKIKPKKGITRVRVKKRKKQKKKGRRRGHGSRKGAKKARLPKKEAWMKRIRAQRALLKKLRDSEKLSKTHYRKVYMLAKAGTFKSKAHLLAYLKDNKLLKEQNKKK